MTNQLPIQQEDRTIVVDVLRGFALFGVLQGNLAGMLTNNVPAAIINNHSTAFDQALSVAHDILVENKFMTLFSILFGYGFGVIMQRLENKAIDSTPFFLRRMFWLFIFGCINLTFWNGDILHLYAITGIFLLLFRKQSDRLILLYSVFFLFVLPTIVRLGQHFILQSSLDENALTMKYYEAYKFGSLKDVASTNYQTYFPQWVYTWVEWRDMSETLGRFLLGYYILRRRLLVRMDDNISLIRRVWGWTFIIALAYFSLVLLTEKRVLSAPGYILYPFLKIGILATTLFYASSIVQLFMKNRLEWLTTAFRNLGRMTLTNYLLQTAIYVIVFYRIGFGLLGDYSFGPIWLAALVIYFLQGFFSRWWLLKFYYGPVEWIWRQLTYRRKFKLMRPA